MIEIIYMEFKYECVCAAEGKEVKSDIINNLMTKINTH